MPRDFFPRSDADASGFTRSFSDLINANPALYHISPERAAAYADMQLAYAQAFHATANPGTATRSGRAARREKRRVLERETRLIARLIRAQTSIPTKAMVDIGVKVRRPPRRIAPPTAAPQVLVRSVIGHSITVDLIDADGGKRRLPAGATHAVVLVYRDTGDFRPSSSRLGLPRLTSRTRVRVDLPPSAGDFRLTPGTRVWITAAWTNRRGQQGPFSNPVYAHIAGGAMTFRTTLRAA